MGGYNGLFFAPMLLTKLVKGLVRARRLTKGDEATLVRLHLNTVSKKNSNKPEVDRPETNMHYALSLIRWGNSKHDIGYPTLGGSIAQKPMAVMQYYEYVI